ncbi:MAG: SagB/ThcOx family dehydrogenase [Labilithrix sp.]|nr:SagB/ThcOx family dehydrogenase [Labilithrix sp.]
MSRTPRTLDELDETNRFPVSALFHEATKLTRARMLELQERIDAAGAGAPARKIYPTRPSTPLARKKRARFGGPRLDDVLAARRSPRGGFRDAPIAAETLGALLDASLGETAEGLRAWPSAGALYPLEIYLVATAVEGVSAGIHHFDPVAHRLAQIGDPIAKEALAELVFARGPRGEDRWAHAAGALVLTAVFARTQQKYGERGYRFAHIEAGHAAQNVLLAACALGLSALPIGGFCEDALGDALGLDPAVESPIYVVLLGSA